MVPESDSELHGAGVCCSLDVLLCRETTSVAITTPRTLAGTRLSWKMIKVQLSQAGSSGKGLFGCRNTSPCLLVQNHT